jgi:hypothetical protein
MQQGRNLQHISAGTRHRGITAETLEARQVREDPCGAILKAHVWNAKTSDNAGIDGAQRNKNVQRIDRVGRHAWQRESGYTLRSLVETARDR